MKRLSLSELLTLFISIIALTVSLWQGYESRKHNRLSVTPKLNIEITKNQRDGNFELVIKNQGVGPAIIQEIELVQEGEIIKTPMLTSAYWEQLLNPKHTVSPYAYKTTYEHIQRDYYIRPEEMIRLLTIKQLDSSSWTDIEAALKKVNFTVHYRSIYEENFQMPLDLSNVL